MSNKEKYYNTVKKNLDKAISTLGPYFDVYVKKGNSIEVRFNSEFNDNKNNPRYAFNFNKYGRYIIRRHFDGFCHSIGMKYTYEECVELYNSLIDEEIKRAKEVIEAHKKQKIIVEGA